MTEMRIGDQTIRYDRDATAAAYATIERGFAEECDCVFCQNFVVQRHLVYPPSFRKLLEELGVEPDKEAEVFHLTPIENGFHLYGGWFYLVGEMVATGEQNVRASGSHHFESFFTSIGPNVPAFRVNPRLTLEFSTHLKWTLQTSP